MPYAVSRSRTANGEANKLYLEDKPVHEWYRFVLSFPPHLVRQYLDRFELRPDQYVLDPFCGTGTTLVEAKKRGLNGIGIEANPMAQFSACVKADWSPDPHGLQSHAREIANRAWQQISDEGVPDEPAIAGLSHPFRTLPPESASILLANSMSPAPLHKALVLLECIEQGRDESYYRHERLAFAKSIVFNSSNLAFGPEVGLGTIRPDVPVIQPWLASVLAMADDLQNLHQQTHVQTEVHLSDARNAAQVLSPQSVDAVITSPPYPNEKDYTRTTRLESVLLGFIRDKAELRALKAGLVRSNTRGVYKADTDDHWIESNPEIQRIAREIEDRRIELGKTSGFERMYARVAKLYFGGMYRHLADLRPALRPDARLAYVVGDQASYLRVMIRTGEILADLARQLGYEVEGIDLFRTRLATATREQLREEVVILRWPGA